MSAKNFVLDTCVLLHHAGSIRSFGKNNVVIPYVVLEELDKYKTYDNEIGRNAREVGRLLDKLRREGKLTDGVTVNEVGGTVRVELNHSASEHPNLKLDNNDDRILNVCLGLHRLTGSSILITRDINLAIRADVLGIEAQDYQSDKIANTIDELYKGTLQVDLDDQLIQNFYAGSDVYPHELGVEVYPNQYITLASNSSGKRALVRVVDQNKPLSKLRGGPAAFGVAPKNREQHFAFDALLDPSISLTTLTGPAGSGKTLLSLACALELVQERHVYDRLIVSRPIQPLGKDIGFLPGNILEKMDPWMGPIKDSLSFLMGSKGKTRDVYGEMIAMGMLEVEPMTYIRGRSLPKTLFLIDECQDLSRPEVKTLVSRMGEGSKIILIGDIQQLTNPYLDSMNNGLSHVIEKFKPYNFAAHVSMTKGERSTLATVAAEIL